MSEDAEDDDDFDEGDDSEVELDEFEELDDEEEESPLKFSSNARRRLEQLKEEKELERMLRGDFWD